ncbi:50S ribosomal protein [Pseudohyphozyma bogoriensis]|nr:50S ribosomal protein [Pseudohyphozyma bogoriensis]
MLRRALPSLQRSFSSTATASTSSAPAPAASAAAAAEHTHYLVTLLRSPSHLPPPKAAACKTLGLTHRLSSSFVPISPEAAGSILAVKELVGVRTVGMDDISKVNARRVREGEEGKKGSGLRSHGTLGGTIRIGTERANGDERGFRVEKRA